MGGGGVVVSQNTFERLLVKDFYLLCNQVIVALVGLH